MAHDADIAVLHLDVLAYEDLRHSALAPVLQDHRASNLARHRLDEQGVSIA
jgi:hypothetical protein